jgi:hypothetical protein
MSIDESEQETREFDLDGGGSLEARMRARREEVESLVSEKFPLPRYETMVAVELRFQGYERQRAMFERNKRQRTVALKELYTACDQILGATQAFYELAGADDEEGKRTEHSWYSLAQGVLGDKFNDESTPRQAMLALIGAEQVPTLWNDWQEWMSGQRMDVDREVERDFRTTK